MSQIKKLGYRIKGHRRLSSASYPVTGYRFVFVCIMLLLEMDCDVSEGQAGQPASKTVRV